jgi:tRNA-specific 2-thiouridylase
MITARHCSKKCLLRGSGYLRCPPRGRGARLPALRPQLRNNFKDESVIDDFADSYLRGETPIPCVRCNQTVKFRDLLESRQATSAPIAWRQVITSSARLKPGKAAACCARIDPGKDQSYFLFATTQEQLDFLRFPLGGWSKDVTRQHAERLGLITADKPDSQDICFVPNGDYAKVVKKIRPEAKSTATIEHIDGRVLGTHEGIIHYTIGQRKGLGIGGGVRRTTIRFMSSRSILPMHEVLVGPKEALAREIRHFARASRCLL